MERLLNCSLLEKLYEDRNEDLSHIIIKKCPEYKKSLKEMEDKLKELLNYTDLVLLDIKHIDNDKCINLTGLSNANELNFAKYLSDNEIHMWIRQVLVPTITDNESDLKKLKEFISTLKTVDKVEILPYHNLGKYKWDELGEKYELEDIKPPTLEEFERAKKILEIS